MNESAASRLAWPALLLIALLAAGCRAAPAPPPLDGAAMGGPFTLTGDDGRRVSDADFAGKYRLVYFGFTHCPDVCPIDLQTVSAGLAQFDRAAPERAARVQPLFITVDPARDTPEILHRYVAAFHPRLIGLTGSEAEIASVARAYAVYFRRAAPQAGGGYSVDHSRMAVLYGPAGEPIAIVPHDRGAAAVAADLDRWVR